MVATKFETALVLKGDPNDHSQLKNIQDEHPLSMPMGGSCLIIEDVSPGKKVTTNYVLKRTVKPPQPLKLEG